jgi:hypothetical protein
VHQNGSAGVIGSDKVQAILLHFGIADTVMASGTMCSVDCPPNEHLERRPGPMKMLVGGSAGAAKIKNCQSLPIRSRPQKLLWRSVPLQAKTRLQHAIVLANNFRRSALGDQALAILLAVCLIKPSSVLLRSSLLAYRSLALPSQVR